MMQDPHNVNALRMAEVTRFNHEANSADLVFLDDRSRISDVSILSGAASPRSGWVDYPKRDDWPEDQPRRVSDTDQMYCLAVVAMMVGRPVVLGFVYPPVTEMAFDPERWPNLAIYRHPSDTHVVFQDDGSVEVQHPSGAFLKIGTEATATNLEGEDFDEKWETRRNKEQSLHVRIHNPGTDQEKPTTITMTPEGEINISARKNISVMSEEGSILISAAQSIDLNAGCVRANGAAIHRVGDTDSANDIAVTGAC